MIGKLIIIQFISHFIGDYYLQSGTIAKKKSNSYYYTFIHSVIYTIPYYAVWILFCQFDKMLLIYTSILAWSHCFVDLLKVYFTVQKKYKMNGNVLYVVDQVTHYLIIFMVSIFMLSDYKFDFVIPVDFYVLGMCLLLIVLHQPYYVSAKVLFCKNKVITNTFSKEECLLKCSGVVLGILSIFIPLWILFFGGLVYYVYSKKEIVGYWNGALLICLLFIPILG